MVLYMISNIQIEDVPYPNIVICLNSSRKFIMLGKSMNCSRVWSNRYIGNSYEIH